MVYYSGDGSNGLALLVDARTKTCREIDGCLDLWGVGNRYLGKREWKSTLRIALRDYGTKPWSMAEVREHKAEVDTIIKQAGITTVAMMQSPLIPGVKTVHSAWNMFGRAGSPYKWGGTVWQEDGLWRAPLLNPQSYEYAYGWLFQRWFVQALAVAKGRVRPLPWPTRSIHPSRDMVAYLHEIANDPGPIGFDIETGMDGKMISAIGLSTATHAVSIPWEEFRIAGTAEYSPGVGSHQFGPLVRDMALDILAADVPKVGHNATFDVLHLSKRGIKVGGELHDTLLMARVAYPQYRRGLQQAAAIEYCVSPWKSEYKKPRLESKDEDIWLADPEGLREYNTLDAFVTRKLFDSLRHKVGI